MEGHTTRVMLLASVIIAAITFAVFSPILKNDFTNWDDEIYITRNQDIRSFSPLSLFRVFSSFYVGNYQPLAMLTYMVDYRIFGLNPAGYHLTALIWHILNALLVFCLIYLLSRDHAISFMTAMLFAIHPLHVESVAWASARKDVCYAFFFLASLIAYFLYVHSGKKRRFFFFSLVLFTCAILSKIMAITLPVILLLLDSAAGRRQGKESLKEKIPFFLVSGIFGVIALLGQGTQGRTEDHLDIAYKCVVSGHAALFYLQKMVLPVNLSSYYLYCGPGNIYNYPVYLYYYLLFLCCIAASWAIMKYSSAAKFGILFYCIHLFPVLQFVPLGRTIVADRYTYIPLIGIFYVISVYAMRLARRKIRFAGALKAATSAALAVMLISCGYLAWQRCHVWRDSYTLWSDVLRAYPNSITAFSSRGYYYLSTRDYANARKEFDKAIAVNQGFFKSYASRGILYYEQGHYEKALADLNRAIELDPRYEKAYYYRALIAYKNARYQEAITDLTKTAELNKRHTGAFCYRGIIYDELGETKKALDDFTRVLRLDPWNIDAYYNRGVTYYRIGDYRRAIDDFSRTISLNPRFVDAYNNRAIAYFYAGEYAKSRADTALLKKMGYSVNEDLLKKLREIPI